jgi:MIP family channel proteins
MSGPRTGTVPAPSPAGTDGAGDAQPPAGASLLGAYAAELIGTFLYVWMGTGTILATTVVVHGHARLNDVAVSVAFAFAVLAAVYVTAPLSGAHLNPAVTVALATTRRFPWRAVPGYLAAQVAGGLLAALANWVLFGSSARSQLILGATKPGPSGAPVALLAEFILTFLLMVTVMATAVGDRSVGPSTTGLSIGLVVGAGIFAMINVSGGSFNPARTFGPMIVSAQFPGWYAYLIGPIAGAVTGALAWKYVLRRGFQPQV